MAARRLVDMVLVAALAMFGMSLAVDAEQEARGQGTGRTRKPDDRLAGQAAVGRDAEWPGQIPARGWWQIAKRVFGRFNDDRVMTEAAGVTFFTLLASFPAIASLISIFGLVADPAEIGKHLSLAAGVIPAGGMQIIGEQVKTLTSQPPKALGLGLVLGIVISLWSANAGMKSLFDALNVVYEEKETRSFLRRTLTSLCLTLGGMLFVILALGAVVVVPAVLNFVNLGGTLDTIVDLARWPLMLVAVAVMLSCIYRFGPSRVKPQWRWLTIGSLFAAIIWVAASAGFSWYVSSFGSYNKTYGSLGAAIGFMTWIWISTMIVLVGGELNAQMEHQTSRDTTAGADKPLGARGARMADEVAAA